MDSQFLEKLHLVMCDMVSIGGQKSNFQRLLLDAIRPPTADSIWVRLASESGVIARNGTEVQTVTTAAIALIHQASALLDDFQDGDPLLAEIASNQVVNVAVAMSFAPLHALPSMLKSFTPPRCIATIQAEVASTVMQMCSGQFAEAIQLNPGQSNGALEAYEIIVREKIGSFAALCAKLPAIAGNLDGNLIDALAEVGLYIGLLYQIGNDYAGLSANDRNRKTDVGHIWTWPTLYTLQVESEVGRQFFLRAWKMQDVATVYQCALNAGALEFLLILASTYQTQAFKTLDLLNPYFDTSGLQILIKSAFPPLIEV